jgi:hypothetical protein
LAVEPDTPVAAVVTLVGPNPAAPVVLDPVIPEGPSPLAVAFWALDVPLDPLDVTDPPDPPGLGLLAGAATMSLAMSAVASVTRAAVSGT